MLESDYRLPFTLLPLPFSTVIQSERQNDRKHCDWLIGICAEYRMSGAALSYKHQFCRNSSFKKNNQNQSISYGAI